MTRINDDCKNILAVVEHKNAAGVDVDEVGVFEELYHSNQHYGWQIEMLGINILGFWLCKHGYLEKPFGYYRVTQKGKRVFGKGCPV